MRIYDIRSTKYAALHIFCIKAELEFSRVFPECIPKFPEFTVKNPYETPSKQNLNPKFVLNQTLLLLSVKCNEIAELLKICVNILYYIMGDYYTTKSEQSDHGKYLN